MFNLNIEHIQYIDLQFRLLEALPLHLPLNRTSLRPHLVSQISLMATALAMSHCLLGPFGDSSVSSLWRYRKQRGSRRHSRRYKSSTRGLSSKLARRLSRVWITSVAFS